MRLDGLALRGGMGQLERGGVEHLAGHGHEARVARALETEHAVAHHGMADRRKMAADLVRAAGLDADAQERRLVANGLARYVRDGGLAVQRRVHRHVRMREAPHDDRPVLLLDEVRLEHLHGGLPRGFGAGEEQAARGVAVEAVHGLYGGVAQLLAQDRLHAVRIVGAACGSMNFTH